MIGVLIKKEDLDTGTHLGRILANPQKLEERYGRASSSQPSGGSNPADILIDLSIPQNKIKIKAPLPKDDMLLNTCL